MVMAVTAFTAVQQESCQRLETLFESGFDGHRYDGDAYQGGQRQNRILTSC
jgi:hypothetical protein